MIFYYLLAILAALCWAIASLISVDITRTIGGLVFNRLRLFFVSIMLLVYTTIINTWETIIFDYLNTILISGVIGIFLGDTFSTPKVTISFFIFIFILKKGIVSDKEYFGSKSAKFLVSQN